MGKKFVGLDGLKHFWTIAKSWIAGRITGEVTARIAEVVADAPEDLDTLKEIADWISTHADSASEMNTQIQTNKDNIAANTSDISALQISVSEKANKVHSHDNRYYTESEIDTKLSGKSNTGHTHTKSQITDFPTSLPAKGGTADSATTAGTATTAAKLGRNGNTDIPMTFNWSGQGGQPSWLWGGNDGSNMYVYNPSNFSVNRASTAGTADYARNMYYQNLDLSALDKTKFYPLVCNSWTNFPEVAICSETFIGTMDYNQNRIHFDISTLGWTDTPPTLNIREYACYDNNEITIGCIGRGQHDGAWAIWLRGGLHYTCFSRNSDLSLKTSDFTYDGDETYTIGTNYYGGSNSYVDIMFTPQSTIKDGAYSSRQITAPEIKANNRLAIPIGAPSILVDGCIWIER